MEKDRAGAGAGVVDLDKTTTTLEPEKPTDGGLYVPDKERVAYVPQERKSRSGLDAIASAKQGGSQHDGGFKLPKERTTSIAASTQDEDKFESSVFEESGHDGIVGRHKHTNRRYRNSTSESSEASHAEGSVTEDHHYVDTNRTCSTDSDVPASPSRYDHGIIRVRGGIPGMIQEALVEEFRVRTTTRAGMIGMMADGKKKILHEETVFLVLDVINLHHPQCL